MLYVLAKATVCSIENRCETSRQLNHSSGSGLCLGSLQVFMGSCLFTFQGCWISTFIDVD